MTRSTTPRFGTSKPPALLKYPGLIDIKDAPELKGVMAYVIKAYDSGISVLVSATQVADGINFRTVIGDWEGHAIDMRVPSEFQVMGLHFLGDHWRRFVEIFRTVGIPQAQVFLGRTQPGGELVLTDIQIAANKLAGPGMIRDLFSKIIQVQEVVKIVTMDNPTIEAIVGGADPFVGKLIIKPSKFRTVIRRVAVPLYVSVRI